MKVYRYWWVNLVSGEHGTVCRVLADELTFLRMLNKSNDERVGSFQYWADGTYTPRDLTEEEARVFRLFKLSPQDAYEEGKL